MVRLARLVTGVLLVPLLALPAGAAPPLVDVDDAETVVLPARDAEDRLSPVENSWRSSVHGIGLAAGSDELSARHFFRLAGSDRLVEVAGVGYGDVAVGPGGTVVVLPTGYDVTRGRDVRVLDGGTGEDVRTALVNGFLLALTDGGALTSVGGTNGEDVQVRLTDLRDGTVRTLATVPAGRLVESEADERGAVLAVRSADGASVDVVAVGLDGTQRTLGSYAREARDRPFPVQALRVAPSHTAFRSYGADGRSAVVVLRRDGTGSPQVRPVLDVQGIAVTDDAVAWFGRTDFDGGREVRLQTAPHDPAQPATVVPVRGFLSTSELQSGPGGFVVPQAADQPVPGFALVRPGSTVLEPYVRTPREPAVLDELTLDAGRLVVSDEVLDGDLAVRDVEVSGGRLEVGPERVLPAGGSTLAQTVVGSRTLSLDAGATGLALVVTDQDRGEQLRVPVGEDLQASQLSGRRLLVERGDDAGTTGGTRLYDVPTGVTLDLPRGAALWGPYVAYRDDAGRVVRRDLDRPGSPLAVVRSNVRRGAYVQVDGDDVLVDTGDRASGSGATVSRVRGTAVQTAPVEQLSVTTEPLLGGGALLVVGGQRVQVLDVGDALRGAAPFSVGSSAEDVPAVVDDDVVAWQGGDGRVRVRPQRAGTARAVRALSTTAAAATTGAWLLEAEVSEALRSVRLELRDSAGRTVAAPPATARHGSVRALWDGRLSDGRTAPDGVYRWVLSGADADGDGALTGADGGPVPTGTVAVRRAAPALTLTAPGVSATASTGRSFPVRWTAPAGLRVDLRYAEVVDGSAGPSRPWLTGTTTRSAVFGVTGAPRLTPGRTYRITVTARDEFGRAATPRSVTTAVPLDDRASGLRYAGAWSSTGASGRYSGTLRTSTARGASVTVTGAARTLAVVADRCTTCGRFDVVLDGKVVGRVDTRASSTRVRQVVWSRAVPAPGRHVLQLRVVSGRVALDGIALGQ